MLSSTFSIRPSPPGISNACLKAMVIIKLGTTCAIYPRLENRVEVELWYFKFQVLANTVPKLEQAKPAPKYKQPKMSDLFKKI